MTILKKTLCARKEYRCESDQPPHDAHLYNQGIIRKGDLYVRLSVPPGDDELDNGVWWWRRVCENHGEDYSQQAIDAHARHRRGAR